MSVSECSKVLNSRRTFHSNIKHHQMQLKSVFKVMILFMLKNKKKTCIKVQNWSACRMEVEKFKDLACLHFT